MENKQHVTKQMIGQWRNQRRNWNILSTESRNTTDPNQWYAKKAIPRKKFIAMQTYLKKQEQSQTI